MLALKRKRQEQQEYLEQERSGGKGGDVFGMKKEEIHFRSIQERKKKSVTQKTIGKNRSAIALERKRQEQQDWERLRVSVRLRAS